MRKKLEDEAIHLLSESLTEWIKRKQIKSLSWDLEELSRKHLQAAVNKTEYGGHELFKYVFDQCCKTIQYKVNADKRLEEMKSRPASVMSSISESIVPEASSIDNNQSQDIILKVERGGVAHWPESLPRIKEWHVTAITICNELRTIQNIKEGQIQFAETKAQEKSPLIAEVPIGHYLSIEDLAQAFCASLTRVGSRYYTFQLLPNGCIEFLTYHQDHLKTRDAKPTQVSDELFTLFWDQAPTLARIFGFPSDGATTNLEKDHLEMFHSRGSWPYNIHQPQEIIMRSDMWPHKLICLPLYSKFSTYDHINIHSAQAIVVYDSPMKLDRLSVQFYTLGMDRLELDCPIYMFVKVTT